YKEGSIQSAAYLLFDGREMFHVTHAYGKTRSTQRVLCAMPGQLAAFSLDATPLSWMSKGADRLEIAGIGAEGVLSWLDLEFRVGELIATTRISAAGPFRAASITRSGVVAAVAKDRIVWLRAGPGGMKEHLRQRLSLPDVVSCYPNNDTLELIVISGNGTVARVRQAV